MSGVVEIAKKAGVSPATVSRALRGMNHVNESTRSKIVAAAMELSYPLRPDLIPQGLVKRTNRIGVIAPYISRWFFSQAINGIEQSLREVGMDLLLYNFSQVDARQRIFQQKQLRGKVDALIVVSMPPTDEEFTSLLSLGIPITTIGFIHEGCTSIAIDDVEGGRVATKHLTDLGHREIAVLSGQRETAYNFDVSDNRTKGYIEVLNSVGVEWNPDYEIRGDFNIYTSEIAMESFLRRKKLPTALFCHSDEMAFGALKAIRNKGMRVPEDISVITLHNSALTEFLAPPLTSVMLPAKEMGEVSAEKLIEMLNGKKIKHVLIEGKPALVLRGSTKQPKK